MLAVPSVAFAEWRLEVKDLTSKEIRTYGPPTAETFKVPVAMAGWKCILEPEADRDMRFIVCRLKGGQVVTSSATKERWLIMKVGKGDAEWMLTLNYER